MDHIGKHWTCGITWIRLFKHEFSDRAKANLVMDLSLVDQAQVKK
jgi:hypothetical protein